ncbi:hypothetical protein PENSPDRAFT_651503 [Peniophora sp. CONT]|nr:hypothetical protein PENSPDRAFT_651503 [Peniophora sp. CONT]
MSPIHNLSDDILMMLFLHFPAIPASWCRGTASDEVAPDFTWMYITHVCRRWRNVSLGCSLIWTHINFKPPSWAPVFLERAREAPLHIDVDWRRDGSRHHIDDAVAMALGHLHHTRYLVLVNPPAQFMKDALSILQQQVVDKLEVLHLHNVDEVSASLSLGLAMTTIELPDAIFARPASRLCELMIQGQCTLSSRNHLFSSRLTHLRLTGLSRSPFNTMDELLGCLRTCPLEELFLESCLSSHTTQMTLPPLPKGYMLVDMPTLRSFAIVDFTMRIADLFRRLRIPARCRFQIGNGHRWHSDNASAAAISEALATEADLVLATRLTLQNPVLIISQRQFNECVWRFYDLESPTPLVSFRDEIAEARYEFTLAMRSHPKATTMGEMMRDADAYAGTFSRVMPIYHLDSLHILSISAISGSLISLDTWLVTLRELHRLVVLRVKGPCCYNFATALALLSDNHRCFHAFKNLGSFTRIWLTHLDRVDWP